MTGPELVIRAARAVLPEGERAASCAVRGGLIEAVGAFDAPYPGAARETVLGPDEVLLPGLIDQHVHVNEPGRTEWEGFASATKAAAAGGVTTIVDMPLNSVPPTVTPAALDLKARAATGKITVDVGFWGGAVPGNTDQLAALWQRGVFGFKSFLAPSGVAEFDQVATSQLAEAMTEIARFGGLQIVHAEDGDVLGQAPRPSGRRYADFLASRPREAENRAVRAVIELVEATGCRTHILHLSSAEALDDIAQAKRAGLPLSVETCPHYLTFAAEQVPNGATQFKCCPPIRQAANRERLWDGLRSGLIDLVASDHSPSTPKLKCLDTGDFGAAWGGIASVQLGLSAVWTGWRARGGSLAQVARWMAETPARVLGLDAKGRIAPGADADFAVFAPDDAVQVAAADLHHRNPLTPYEGMELFGRVRATYLRGQPVDFAQPRGRLVARP